VIRVKVLQVTNESSDREFKPIRNLSIETRRIKRPHSSQETLEGVSHDVKRDSRYTVCFFVGIFGREDRVVIEGEAEECVEEAKGVRVGGCSASDQRRHLLAGHVESMDSEGSIEERRNELPRNEVTAS
jgi:hypothetical protein